MLVTKIINLNRGLPEVNYVDKLPDISLYHLKAALDRDKKFHIHKGEIIPRDTVRDYSSANGFTSMSIGKSNIVILSPGNIEMWAHHYNCIEFLKTEINQHQQGLIDKYVTVDDADKYIFVFGNVIPGDYGICRSEFVNSEIRGYEQSSVERLKGKELYHTDNLRILCSSQGLTLNEENEAVIVSMLKGGNQDRVLAMNMLSGVNLKTSIGRLLTFYRNYRFEIESTHFSNVNVKSLNKIIDPLVNIDSLNKISRLLDKGLLTKESFIHLKGEVDRQCDHHYSNDCFSIAKTKPTQRVINYFKNKEYENT